MKLNKNVRNTKMAEMIDTIARLEAQTEWIEGIMEKSSDQRLVMLAPLTNPAKQMFFAAAAQLTSDLYDKATVLALRPSYAVEAPIDGDEAVFVLQAVTEVAEAAQKAVRELSLWTGTAVPMLFDKVLPWRSDTLTPEKMRSSTGKLRAAYVQIDGTKSALAVTLAGYNYLERFDDDGDVRLELPTDNQTYGGYA